MAQSKETPIVIISRTEWFCAAHRLHNSCLSKEENAKLYTKCNSQNGHGHNYRVTVSLRGPVDDATGMVVSNDDLKVHMERAFLSCLDHKHLDKDVPYFKDKVSTGENLVVFIWKKLEEELPKGLLYEVKMKETEKNWFTYRGENS